MEDGCEADERRACYEWHFAVGELRIISCIPGPLLLF